MKRRILFKSKTLIGFIVLSVALGAFGVSNAFAKAKYTFRAAGQVPDDYPWTDGLKMFKKLTEERTKGQVAVKIFTGGVLGSDM